MVPRTYATDLFTDQAVKIIQDHNSTDSPLFLLLNHLAPHAANGILQAPEAEIAKFASIADPNRRIYAGK